ncbi:hypothetical protein [Streptomyces tardus]|uniref:hypothetical protein n=1 Tax=Streptomyces tardus TaxID=2780544 RepID=UPI0027E5BA80|nr:hypothetical protein [Streptomyces tardus]
MATVVGVSAAVLWPSRVRQAAKSGSDREVVATYPYRNACPTSVWTSLVDQAENVIEYAGYTNYFIWQEQPRLTERLREKAESGCEVRFLIGDPDSRVTRDREAVENVPLTLTTRIRITLGALEALRELPCVQARFSDQHVALSVFRFDDQMLVTPHLSSLLGHESPTLHLRRLTEDGLFDRFAGHVTALWERSDRPVW